MEGLITKANLNTEKGRVYIHLKALMDTDFKPGANYKYELNKNDKCMNIYLNDEGNMKVSKRRLKDRIQSVIDLKSKDVINTFKGLMMETEIYKDKIIVRGVDTSKTSDVSNIREDNKVTCFDKFKAKKYVKELCFNKKQFNSIFFKKVSGEIDGQVSMFDLNYDVNYDTTDNETRFDKLASSKNTLNPSFLASCVNRLTSSFEVISLFSGMGGLDKAFKDMNFKIKFAIDKLFYPLSKKNIYDKDDCSELEGGHIETYKYNVGDHIVASDILTYPIKDIPKGDVYIAGIPCQELSAVSPNRGRFRLLPKFVDRFIEIIKSAKDTCKVFVIENSDRLLTVGREFVDKIKEQLPEFNITENKVDAYDYGSYQHRKRAILIGSRIGEIKLIPPNIKAVKTVSMALEDLNDDIPNQLDYSNPKAVTLEKIKNIKQGQNNQSLSYEQKTKGTFSNSIKRLEADKACISLPNVRKSLILHPFLDRALSVRECLRLFDFDDSFILFGSLHSKQQQVANSVPYALGTAIAETIKKALEVQMNNLVLS